MSPVSEARKPPSQPKPARVQRVAVLVLPHVHLLDLSGAVQVLYEANGFGAHYQLLYCGLEKEARSAQGLVLGRLEPLPSLEGIHLVLVPGVDSRELEQLSAVPVDWLREAHTRGTKVASVCTGAFILGQAGLLDGRECTTHWKLTERLRERFPRAQVLDDRLFVRAGNLITSAGVASGIDMALSLVLEEHGPHVVARTARELVVYLRRDGEQRQSSALLSHRTHLRQGIHDVQDWIVTHPQERMTLRKLARIAAMSTRNLTRSFRLATGTSIKSFTQKVKLEVAATLLEDPNQSVESVASRCGFMDARQLRRVWKQEYGVSPSRWKVGRRN